MGNTGKGIILGVLGGGIVITSFGIMCSIYHAPQKEEEQEAEQGESEFLGEAARSFGVIAGVFVFLLIFLVLVGVALVVYGANKVAKSENTFDENARRTDKIIDIGIKAKQLRR